MQQQYETARPIIGSERTAYHGPQQLTIVGWLPRLKHWMVGKRDPIEQQLHEVERQGHGMARIMHAAGYLMLVLFSVGSAIGICGTLVQEVVANGPLTWQSLPNDVVITVSLMLVFCMDLAAIYAAFHMRLLATRHAPWQQYIIHALVLLTCTVLEGGTFIQMSFEYDNVIAGTVALLIIARGIVAPLLSVYLNMARPIPSGVADIAYQSFLGAGQGVVRDIIHIANDPNASLADKAELMSASAYINQREQAQLDRLIDVARRREERRLPAPHARIVAASSTLPPETPPTEHHISGATDTYKAMHDTDEWDMYGIPDESEDDESTYSTRSLPEVRKPQPSLPRRTPISSGVRSRESYDFEDAPDDDETDDYDTHSRHQRKNGKTATGRKSQRQRKAELARQGMEQQEANARDHIIDQAVNAVMLEITATGEELSGYQLEDRVNEYLARIGSTVRTSRKTVGKKKRIWLAQHSAKAVPVVTDDELEPMEPQELRELVATEAW